MERTDKEGEVGASLFYTVFAFVFGSFSPFFLPDAVLEQSIDCRSQYSTLHPNYSPILLLALRESDPFAGKIIALIEIETREIPLDRNLSHLKLRLWRANNCTR
ncbi:hypothetical protein CEXT_651711 [Caerostris extrusa]|uniref:Uncharacterized protein n=1 Tax=Caerostris extrusa TaxID=172846 RepID=A0AAV4X798_CAEEX|nr:hypothetical protein CEXT_651711 [Caerostris extrusa]